MFRFEASRNRAGGQQGFPSKAANDIEPNFLHRCSCSFTSLCDERNSTDTLPQIHDTMSPQMTRRARKRQLLQKFAAQGQIEVS